MEEVWKDIQGFEGYYQVSNLGRVKSLSRKAWNGHVFVDVKERILRTPTDSVGYPVVVLQKAPYTRCVRVHRLVAEAFIPNPNKWRVVNHLDLNKTNNSVNNLEWCTHKHNIQDARDKGAFEHTMIPVRVVETGMVYRSCKECADAINGDPGHVSDCARGKIKTHRGYHIERYLP